MYKVDGMQRGACAYTKRTAATSHEEEKMEEETSEVALPIWFSSADARRVVVLGYRFEDARGSCARRL